MIKAKKGPPSKQGEPLRKLQRWEGFGSSWVSHGASWESVRASGEGLIATWEDLRARWEAQGGDGRMDGQTKTTKMR